MSIINNLLKDLEKRQVKDNSRVLDSLTLSETPKMRMSNKIFLSTLLVLGALGYYFIWFTPNKKTSAIIQPRFKLSQPSQGISQTPVEPKPVKLNTLSSISLEINNDISELSFFFDNTVLYNVETSGNKVSIVFDNATIKAQLPPIKNFPSAIKEMSTRVEKNNLYFDLVLTPSAHIKYINSNDNRPEIVVAIQDNKTNSDIALLQTPIVKTPAMQSLISQQYQIAINLADKGYFDNSIAKLNSILQTDPGYKDARVSLVALLIDQHHNLLAKTVLEKGLMVDPDYIPFIELKARIYVQEGKRKEALNTLQMASPSIQENPDYHAFLAAVNEQNNNDLVAVKLYKDLLSMNPENSNWWLGLGISLDKLNEKSAAIEAYTKAFQSGHLTADATSYLHKRLQVLQDKPYDSE